MLPAPNPPSHALRLAVSNGAVALTGDKDFDLFNAAYPLAAQHAARLFGARELATMLGEARAAERSLQHLASATPDDDATHSSRATEQHAARRGLKRTLTVRSWC